jgi:hypothetical protein
MTWQPTTVELESVPEAGVSVEQYAREHALAA